MKTLKAIRGLTVLLWACVALAEGCALPDSIFFLANGSRLPAWFEIPQKASRADVGVKFTFYGGEVEVRLTEKGSWLSKKILALTERGRSPVELEASDSQRIYEDFEVLSANGITEVLGFVRSSTDQRLLELWVIDDPALKSAVLQRAAELEAAFRLETGER